MRIGHFMRHTFAAAVLVDRPIFHFQGGGRIGGIVNVLPGIPLPPTP